MPSVTANLKHKFSTSAREEIKAILSTLNTEKSDQEIDEALDQVSKDLAEAILEGHVRRIAEQISHHLPRMVGDMFGSAIKAQFVASANQTADEFGRPEKKLSTDDIKKMILNPFWRSVSGHLGITRGGARHRELTFKWDEEKAKLFYQTVELLPQVSKKPLWEYIQEQLSANDYEADTIGWLKSHPAIADIPDILLEKATRQWRQHDQWWDSLPVEDSPLAYAFYYACHKLGYPQHAYNTLRKRYYEGKKACELAQ